MWNTDNSSQVLWLSGPPECNIHQVSPYIVGLEKEKKHSVLYFFCSSPARGESVTTAFVHTLLCQLLCCSPVDKKTSIVRDFLRALLEGIIKKGAFNQRLLQSKEESPPDMKIKEILNGSSRNELWAALQATLDHKQSWGLLIVIDGLDKVRQEKYQFIDSVRVFIDHLQQRTSKVKILLTSRPQDDIKEVLNRLPCIEYDKERKG